MNVLLDTNIIIHREASKVVNQDIGLLFNWLDRLHYLKCVHPLTIQELNRNLNSSVAETMNAKLKSYNILQAPASLHLDVKAIGDKVDTVPNDLDDTRLLNEVYNNRVDVLITEDKKIHHKAELLGIATRVFRINSFLEKILTEHPDFVDYKILSVRRELFGNINLSDSFFDSFREDYVGFDKWYNNKAGKNEKAYVCYEGNELKAFLFLKVEDENEPYSDTTPIFERKKRLKIGTFKVVSNGLRIGERFLKIVFDNARQYKVAEIYVTMFDKRLEVQSLISLIEKFGFKLHGNKKSLSGVEKVYVKDLTQKADQNHPKLTFPKLSRDADVYTIPIRPEYHTELFPDSILRTEDPMDFIDNEPHRNAISKSYICHSPVRSLKTGDIVVFYRSGGVYKGVATTVGIVENIVTGISNLDELKAVCKKRTVLTDKELSEYWEYNPRSRPFVTNFLYAYSFKKRLTLKQLLDEGILPGMEAVRTIRRLDSQLFIKLINLAGI